MRIKETYDGLESVTLREGGETVSEFTDMSGQPISFAYSEVDCRSSFDFVASVVETEDGKVGVVSGAAGYAQITIVRGDKTYVLFVTVPSLVTGSFRAGAYEVAVMNASEVKYVDGDLVITYLDTTAEKSFTLPQETTGRLLAVGGGGAGGQDIAYSSSYGLPGGGGAGGMVTNDNQNFAAATYVVNVGAGGLAPRALPNKAAKGANGGDSSVVMQDATALATAVGGGGGGARSVGVKGGSGGGGSYSGSSVNGGAGTSGQGSAGGKGTYNRRGAGGGGAGGPGGDTKSLTVADGSGEGGPGAFCDITGENLEYARGGAGGVPRPNAYYYYLNGEKQLTDDKEDPEAGTNKIYFVEAKDGKPGRAGYGDGGGGGGHYGTSTTTSYVTFAGSGGSGVVVVRIPPYAIAVEDALSAAFDGRSATVEDGTVTLTGDVTGPVCIPDNLGAVTIDLAGFRIIGADGADGDDITAGGGGEPAIRIVASEYASKADAATVVPVTGPGSLAGGDGGDGHPAGLGAEALEGDASHFNAGAVSCVKGADGAFVGQHPHEWTYRAEDGRIVATCIADGECSYKTREPFVAVSAADAAFTGGRYDGLTLVNTITGATGLSVPSPTYEGLEWTDYPKTATAPVEQGKYRVELAFRGMTVSDTFTIVDVKPEQDLVYESGNTATRNGDEADIRLTATFSGMRAINDGDVLFLGSRCNAHSMATGTVEKTINTLTDYADVRWYAFGETDPGNNQVGQLTMKGEKLAYTEVGGRVTDETVHLEGGNHFVYKEMMDALYAELVEKKNLRDGYDLILLEFDGDLICREGVPPYQLVYGLPEGWDDDKAAQLRAAMEDYYKAGRVVWLVPDVNQPKSDSGYTGEYPWTSNPDFIWQRAFLGATDTEGYQNPYQKNYEDADELVRYISDRMVAGFFQRTTISDTVKEGLKVNSVTPQVRGEDGFWIDMQKVSSDGGLGGTYAIDDPVFGVAITATVTVTGQKVDVVFDMSGVQQEALDREVVLGNDLQVKIGTTIEDSFFDGMAPDEWKETNEEPATFKFEGSLLDEEFAITTSNAPPKIQNALQLCVFIKPPLVSSGRLRELIGVPWKGADGGDVLLDAYVDKEDLTVGDLLFVYNRSTKGYDGYVLDGGKMWQAAQTLRAKDGEVTGSLAADPKAVRVPVGLAAWIERQDASKPITFRGLPAEGAVDFGLEEGYNLVSGPGPEPFGLEGVSPSAVGDRVILPRYGEEPQVFVREATGWTFRTNAVKSVGGEAVAVPTKVTDPDLMTVPPGFGFWYEKRK